MVAGSHRCAAGAKRLVIRRCSCAIRMIGNLPLRQVVGRPDSGGEGAGLTCSASQVLGCETSHELSSPHCCFRVRECRVTMYFK